MADANRRWFRFSLRTFFVAFTIDGLGAGWLGWNANVVKMRKQMLSELRLRKESEIVHVFMRRDVKT